MKSKLLALVATGAAFASPAAFAQMSVTGSVTPGFIYSDFHGENKYRFNEYRDMRSGGTLGFDVRGDSQSYGLRVFGENIGRDDQFIELKGGHYGLFKYSLYNNNIVHNLTSNAKTPFNVPQQNTLTFAGTGGTAGGQALNVAGGVPTNAFLNVNNWNKFDYGIKHENYGGTFELQSVASSPFYIRATANQKYTKGLRPIGQAGSSPGGPNFELPAVVDYTTTDVSAEAGYATKTAHYAFNASWSKFSDHNDFNFWRNPLLSSAATATTGNIEQNTLTSDNNRWKIAGNAMWKALPLNSTLALRATYAKTTNTIPLAAQGINVSGTTGQLVNFNTNQSNFDGNVAQTTVSASLTSALTKSVDSRVYYNYNDKKNKSSEIVATPRLAPAGASALSCDLNPVTGGNLLAPFNTCSNELFHYRKNNFGVDLNWLVAHGHKLSGGWDWTDTKRERIDFDKTTDNKLYIEYKNSVFDTVTFKAKYQYLDRDSDFQLGNLNPTLSANNFYNLYVKRFDLAGNRQDLFKFVVDATPIELLDLGAELRWKNNDYKDVQLGRKSDERNELYLTASYGDARVFRVSGFFDYETSRYDSAHWVGTPNPATFPASVSTSAYYYDAKVKDRNWVFGIAADWIPAERWKVKGAYIWQKTTGSVDQFPTFPGIVFTNITNYDNFRRNTLNLNGTYTPAQNWDVNLGYSYESYKYSDAQMDGYLNVPLNATNTTVLSTLSGAYANPTYHAHIVYGYLTFRFK